MVEWASKGSIAVVSKAQVPLYIPSSYTRVFHSLHTLANTSMANFEVTHTGGYAVVLYCGFNLPLTNDFKGHFFGQFAAPSFLINIFSNILLVFIRLPIFYY